MDEMKQQLEKYRQWQLNNPEWELICDIENTDFLYIQWNELSKRERMSWLGTYRENAKDAFEEFADKKCKVETSVLCPDMKLRNVSDWPNGFCMLVFKTGTIKGAEPIARAFGCSPKSLLK